MSCFGNSLNFEAVKDHIICDFENCHKRNVSVLGPFFANILDKGWRVAMQINNSISQLINDLKLINSAVSGESNVTQSENFLDLLESSSKLVEELDKKKVVPSEFEEALENGTERDPNIAANTMKSTDWLINDKRLAVKDRPTLSEFMMKTGACAEDASELLYGVIGSNTDLRNWSKIMSSVDPFTAARLATGQLYNSDEDHGTVLKEYSIDEDDVIERDGNFVVVNALGMKDVAVAASRSNVILRSVASSDEQIGRTAWLFGFDKPQLAMNLDK